MQQGCYRLRWRFDYANGQSRYGMWDTPGKADIDQAWNKSHGATRASIEAKNVKTSEVGTIIECRGSDFRNFQWVATAKVPAFSIKGSITPKTQLVGLKLLTTDNEYCVLRSGEINKRPLTDAEKGIQFAAYGR